MQILSHRGLWKQTSEKNTLDSFKKSIDSNFGFEIDIRHLNEQLFVSHDPLNTNQKQLLFDDVLSYYQVNNSDVFIAINIKEDGLDMILNKTLKKFEISNYFFFDMSIPDMVSYYKNDIDFFTRQSEYEIQPALYEEAQGIWLDEFHTHWITLEDLKLHSLNNKKVCIVSPELHKRAHLTEWVNYKKYLSTIEKTDNFFLCTDYPVEAKDFFIDLLT
jgi:glycerophosphoryl diester phosphodiesterase